MPFSHGAFISHRQGPAAGLVGALPIILGYLPYGFIFGLLARQANLTLFEALLMSLLVYAGTSQIIVMGLIQAGQAIEAMVLATFVVNMRYLLMSAAISPALSRWPAIQRSLFGYTLSDETFALLSVKFAEDGPSAAYGFAVNLAAYASWAIFSAAGHLAGAAVPDIKALGLDFALPAVFIALLAGMARDGATALVAVGAGAASIWLAAKGFQNAGVIAAASIATAIGALARLLRAA